MKRKKAAIRPVTKQADRNRSFAFRDRNQGCRMGSCIRVRSLPGLEVDLVAEDEAGNPVVIENQLELKVARRLLALRVCKRQVQRIV